MLNAVGWAGSILFGLCVLPQVWKVYRTHETKSFSWLFFLLWFVGEILSFIYVIATNIQAGIYQYPLLANYFFNFLCLCYLIVAKLKYDKNTYDTVFYSHFAGDVSSNSEIKKSWKDVTKEMLKK